MVQKPSGPSVAGGRTCLSSSLKEQLKSVRLQRLDQPKPSKNPLAHFDQHRHRPVVTKSARLAGFREFIKNEDEKQRGTGLETIAEDEREDQATPSAGGSPRVAQRKKKEKEDRSVMKRMGFGELMRSLDKVDVTSRSGSDDGASEQEPAMIPPAAGDPDRAVIGFLPGGAGNARGRCDSSRFHGSGLVQPINVHSESVASLETILSLGDVKAKGEAAEEDKKGRRKKRRWRDSREPARSDGQPSSSSSGSGSPARRRTEVPPDAVDGAADDGPGAETTNDSSGSRRSTCHDLRRDSENSGEGGRKREGSLERAARQDEKRVSVGPLRSGNSLGGSSNNSNKLTIDSEGNRTRRKRVDTDGDSISGSLSDTGSDGPVVQPEKTRIGVDYDPSDWIGMILHLRGRPTAGAAFYLTAGCSIVYTSLVMQGVIEDVKLDENIHGFVGGALMFLLVFRSQASFKKWMDGLKAWKQISFAARDIIQQAMCYTSDQAIALKMCKYAVAFALACRSYLREEFVEGATLSGILSPSEVKKMVSSEFVPLYAVQVIRQCLAEAVACRKCLPIHMAIELSIKSMTLALAECERMRYALPFVYVVHLRTCLLVYLLCLPLVLTQMLGWGAIVACSMISYALVGLENTAVELDDPFGYDANDLPLDEICVEIQDSLTVILAATMTLQQARAAQAIGRGGLSDSDSDGVGSYSAESNGSPGRGRSPGGSAQMGRSRSMKIRGPATVDRAATIEKLAASDGPDVQLGIFGAGGDVKERLTLLTNLEKMGGSVALGSTRPHRKLATSQSIGPSHSTGANSRGMNLGSGGSHERHKSPRTR